jgi:two-component system sensor histidine kinase BaeS
VIKVNGKVVGTALVALPPPAGLPDVAAFRSEVIGLVLAGGAAGALISLALGLFFARRAARPIRDITTAARAVAAGEPGARAEARRADEFGEMERAFNALADAAEREEKLQQGFAAEVAHELRTPLTILRSQVEGLRAGVLDPTPDALASLDEEVRRMSRLVADLQVLGSADAAAFSLQRSAADLGQLADEAAREFAALFEGSEITLETRLEPVTAWADRTRVGQILANLLSNALKYTPAGGLVRLSVAGDGPWAVLRVTDSGPGIPADELPHVFDRFFRGRTTASPGTGAGLTVVSELARAHGGTAEAASDPGHGATFTIRLPLQATPVRNRVRANPSHPLPSVSA